jgi:hypothetical protein
MANEVGWLHAMVSSKHSAHVMPDLTRTLYHLGRPRMRLPDQHSPGLTLAPGVPGSQALIRLFVVVHPTEFSPLACRALLSNLVLMQPTHTQDQRTCSLLRMT